MKVFISYRRMDSQPFTDRIYDWLEREFGRDITFKDVDNIPYGWDFRLFLQVAVTQCNVFLVVIGPRWLGETDESGRRRVDDPEDWVRIEIETALKRAIPVIPLLVNGASFPRKEDLPPSLQGLIYHHGMPLRPDPDFRPDMERLIRTLRAMGVSRTKPRSWWRTMLSRNNLIGFVLYLILKHTGVFPWAPTPKPAPPVTIADYDEAIRRDPNDATAYVGRGFAWYKKEAYDRAIADFDEAIHRDPNYAAAYVGRGFAWSAKEAYDGAIADFDEAIRLNPKVTYAYTSRGFAWYKKEAYDRAIADYDEAIRLDPKDALAYNGRGNAWLAKEAYDRAIADYDEAIRLDPKFVTAYTNRELAWRAKLRN